MSFKGTCTLNVSKATFDPCDPETHRHSVFSLILRCGSKNHISQESNGPNPTWNEPTTFDVDENQYNVRIGLKGYLPAKTASDQPLTYSCGMVDFDLKSALIEEMGNAIDKTITFRRTLSLPAVTMPIEDEFVFYTLIEVTFTCYSEQFSTAMPTSPTSKTQLIGGASTTQLIGGASTTIASDEGLSPSAPSAPSAPGDYNDDVPYIPNENTNTIINAYPTLPVSDENGTTTAPYNFATSKTPETIPISLPYNPNDFCTIPKQNAIDLHYPIAPTQYLGIKRMTGRILPTTQIPGPNSEKGGEDAPSQVSFVEKLVMPNLNPSKISSLRNPDEGAAFLSLPQRYDSNDFDEKWFQTFPHAWQGVFSSINCYSTQTTVLPNGQLIPSLLVGIECCWRQGNIKKKENADEPIVFAYGYTPTTIKKELGDLFTILPTVKCSTFIINPLDFIIGIDVMTTRFGLSSIRFITANGIESPLLLNNTTADGRLPLNDYQIYSQLKEIKGFEQQSFILRPQYLQQSESIFGVLAYLTVYTRPVSDPDVDLAINAAQNTGPISPITNIIGAVRPWVTHPMKPCEITKDKTIAQRVLGGENLYTPVPVIEEPAIISTAQPHQDFTSMEIEDVQDTQKNTATTTNIPIYSPTTATTTSTSTFVASTNSDAAEGMWLPLIMNFWTLLAMAVVSLIFVLPLSIRTDGPTTCQGFQSKVNMLYIPAALNILFWAFTTGLLLYYIFASCCGCMMINRDPPLRLYRWVSIIWVLLCAVFASVGMAWVFKIEFGCISLAERWVLFTMYLLMLMSCVTVPIAAIATSSGKYLWAHSLLIQWGILILCLSALGGGGKRRRR